MTITPTVTPAPKPEWPELLGSIVSDDCADIFVTSLRPEQMTKSDWRFLATVTIPSSADCERRAAALAELEQASEAVEECDLTNWRAAIQSLKEARRKVKTAMGEGGGK